MAKQTYQLLSNAVVTGPWIICIGASYVWAVVAENFNGGVVVLQAKGPDGVTPMDVATLDANGELPVYVGDGTPMRAAIFGTPINVFSDLRAHDG